MSLSAFVLAAAETDEPSALWASLQAWFERSWWLLLLVVGLTLLARLALPLVAGRLSRVLVRDEPRTDGESKTQRAKTIAHIASKTGATLLYLVALLMLLEVCGVPIEPLLGGAAVFGLAVAFGAQALIKDFFHGLVMLIENQYTLGDVVSVDDVTGTVEQMTLRMTALRAYDGTLHFIPHGAIQKLSNHTHGYSRTIVEVGVAYDADLDLAQKTFAKVLSDLESDETFGPDITGTPKVAGVTRLADSAVVLQAVVTTKPGKQWALTRAILRNVKDAFDAARIEIPYPQTTVHLHQAPSAPSRPA